MKKDAIKAAVLTVILAVVIGIMIGLYNVAFADGYYVLCKPGGEVNIREHPKLKSQIVACVFFGDLLETDGKEQNGFVHVTGLNAEDNSGWIYKGLLTADEPIASEAQTQVFRAERVACRKYASTESKVRKWLKSGDNVTVYAISEKWCVTDAGYIMTEFLTVNPKVR